MDAFNARLISALTSDRLYRIFFDQGEVFFIQIGGQDYGQAIAGMFGALGAAIYGSTQQRAQARLDAKIRDLEAQPPNAHLSASKHNFCATGSDFESSLLQPAAALASHGPHLGRWVLKLRGQKPMTLQLETPSDMRRALEILPATIQVHVNQVMWDAEKE